VETSCDETAAAVVRGDGAVLANAVRSQAALHRPYGGVVPELASREHNLALAQVLRDALADAGIGLEALTAVAATAGPGLASSLLVGNTFAKTLALARGLPFYAVNHLEGHLLSPFAGAGGVVPACVGLVVSGGHTLLVRVEGFGRYRLLGSTRDDAAGEAFDKGAKLLGLPYPGGPELERLARAGNPAAYAFPRSMMEAGNHEFSFSGLKTSLRYLLEGLREEERAERAADVAASYQAAIVEVLAGKALAACASEGLPCLAVSGGVSRNGALRRRLEQDAAGRGVALRWAAPELATDNAAMIGFAAALKLAHRDPATPWDADIDPNLPLPWLER
jgi:N6-L-threonylcarbamoyladenine synthase